MEFAHTSAEQGNEYEAAITSAIRQCPKPSSERRKIKTRKGADCIASESQVVTRGAQSILTSDASAHTPFVTSSK